MLYSLATASGRSRGTGGTIAANVAVFFDRAHWVEFRRGLDACVSRGLARLRMERRGRHFHANHSQRIGSPCTTFAGNLRQDEIRRLVGSPCPGGGGWVQQHGADGGLAEAVWGRGPANAVRSGLADSLGDRGVGAPRVEATQAHGVRRAENRFLLEIARGRTFRFCPNDQVQADSVVRRLLDRSEVTLDRVHGRGP